MKFPIVVLDFEATALTPDSYPIEVGVAILTEPSAQVSTWSALIKPDPAWHIDAQWDYDAERVHGISRWALREGLEPLSVMAELNSLIPPGATVWCDGGHYDVGWLGTLSSASGTMPTFMLGDIGAVLRADDALRIRYLTCLATTPPPHRAGPDAERICRALHAAISEPKSRHPFSENNQE